MALVKCSVGVYEILWTKIFKLGIILADLSYNSYFEKFCLANVPTYCVNNVQGLQLMKCSV